MFGSRVYGTANEFSDYDFIVLASSMMEKQEIRHKEYNIHVHIPSVFLDGLKEYQMQYLECIYAPPDTKLQEKLVLPDKTFQLKPDMLVYKGMNQSYNSFNKAKEKIIDGDLYRGTKGIFHSIRILQFFHQIIENGKITDFSSANDIWDMLKEDYDNEVSDWKYYKEKYLPIKIKFEQLITKK
jgi:predicted nucleotidyltransferase